MSTRRLLRVLLALQAFAALGIAWAVMHWFGVKAAWLAALAGLASVLAVRLLITANNFAMSARYASATPDSFHLGALARLRLFAEEFMATMLHSSWFMARGAAGERVYPDSRHRPVLLVHGYGCNAGYWTQLVRRLDAAGISHAALDLEPLLADIDDYVPLVQRALDRLCAQSGAPQAIIVAHSMGGLVARAFLRAHGAARVAHVFTLGTPHHGTSLASFGLGRNAQQMRYPGAGAKGEATWLQGLAASEDAGKRALITSIYTHHDNIVAPQTSSVLPGARHIEFGGVGHVAMGRNPRILTRLMHEIDQFATR
jgi:triacylglycerol esterase/lipase EstA (alpha/beta hydrolase family)